MNTYARNNNFSLNWSQKDDWICGACNASNYVCACLPLTLPYAAGVTFVPILNPSSIYASGHDGFVLQMLQMDQSHDGWASIVRKGSRFIAEDQG
jgi:hypothetical protein